MNLVKSELLDQFAAETLQHLNDIERILQEQSRIADKGAIASLFRAFHSLKALAGLLGLRGMERLAHEVESLLGEVRAELLPVDDALASLLLEALDAVRDQREQSIMAGLDVPPNMKLLALLERARSRSATRSDLAHAQPAIALALHHDADTLVFFAELMAEILPELASAAQGSVMNAVALDNIEMLIIAAERVAFHGLRARLRALAENGSSVDRLAAVIADARRFGQIIQQDAGAAASLLAFAEPLRSTMARVAQSLTEAINAGGATTSISLAERLVALAAAGIDDGGVCTLVLQAVACGRAADETLRALHQLSMQFAQASDTGSDLLALEAERLRGALASPPLSPPLRRVLEDCGVDPALLGDTRTERLGLLLEGGRNKLVCVTVAVPADAERIEVLRWLGARLEPVSVHQMPLGEGIALLAVATEDVDALRSLILEACPNLLFVEARAFRDQVFSHPWEFVRRAAADAGASGENQVRVPVEILDRLFGRIGEFFGISSALNVVIVDSQAPLMLHRLADHVAVAAPALMPSIEVLQRQQDDLAQIEIEVHRLVSLIHEATLGLRVIPLEIVFNRFPKMIRELARARGKQVRFQPQAGGIKVDKGMTELLADPLMHMLRNAIDHGVEAPDERAELGKPPIATIRLSAIQNGNRIVVEVADDGRGIETEKVRLKAVALGLISEAESHKLSRDQLHRFIFSPGFSTAEQITDTSGRGVGLDVALINVSRLGGRIDIHSVPGQGTTWRLDMPLSAAIQAVLLAETSMQTIAFPERMVVEAATVSVDAVQYVNGQRAILLHNRFLPLFGVSELLQLPDKPHARMGEDVSIVVVASGRFRYGVEVNRILRRHEMLIRETHPRIAQLPGIGGVATLGSDRIVLVVDPEGLTDLARRAVTPGMRVAQTAAE